METREARLLFFDPLFEVLGIEFKTAGKASWENYQKYLSIIRTIQQYLIDKEYLDTRLIDAHSFCWMVSILARDDGTNNTFSKRAIQKRDYVPFEMLTKITPNKPSNISNPNINSIPPSRISIVGTFGKKSLPTEKHIKIKS